MIRSTRKVSWIKAAWKDFSKFPQNSQERAGAALTMIGEGATPDIAKPLPGLGSGIWELAIKSRGDAFRVVYALQMGEDIWVIHAFQKKSTKGVATPKREIDLVKERIKRLREQISMSTRKPAKIATVRGSGNVFRDLGRADAEVLQLKALLAAEIVRALDEQGLTVRKAQSHTGIAAADFSRIRNADLKRFTVDRLMTVAKRLGRDLNVAVTVRARHPVRPKGIDVESLRRLTASSPRQLVSAGEFIRKMRDEDRY
jgi:phage-related protein/predicted XRE-type DNA-binding protein